MTARTLARADDGRESEHQLVARIRAGDEGAFETLFRAYFVELARFAGHVVGSPVVGEDVAQDVLFAIWRHRERWEISGSLKAYLFEAVRRGAVMRIRHDRVEVRWRERAVHGEDAAALTHAPAQADEQLREDDAATIIERAIAELPSRTRQAFLLRRRQGLSYAEIGQVMGISVRTVEAQIGAALRMLRERLMESLG